MPTPPTAPARVPLTEAEIPQMSAETTRQLVIDAVRFAERTHGITPAQGEQK